MIAVNNASFPDPLRQQELTLEAQALNAVLDLQISGLIRAGDILRRDEALFSSIIDLVPVGIYVVNSQFRMQLINPHAIAAFCGLDPLIGRDFSEIMHCIWPHPRADELIARFRNTLETGEPYQSCEFSERRLDTGIKEIYEWEIQRVTLPGGEKCVLCLFSNITDRKNAKTTQRRIDILSASNIQLKREILQHQTVEDALQRTQQEQIHLLSQSKDQESVLRNISHRLLSAQEDERKRISKELHDVISQNLIGINVSMDTLSRTDPSAFPGDFRRRITETQRIVESTVERLHDFARELRPALLDDLGLIPALHTLLESFMANTGIRSSLTAFAGIEKSGGDVLTVLYRVVQEALANVSKHGNASQVAVTITKAAGDIKMEIRDDGIGFDASAATISSLGLLGMKERVEMVGGVFQIDSSPGNGTIVRAVLKNKP